MNTEINNYHLRELERLFANDLQSPIFPLLAQQYINCAQFDKAQKVCEIGLKFNPKNMIGQYVLSQVYICNNYYIKSEKILKNVIKFDTCNYQALITLIKIQIKLSRSIKTIKKNVLLAYSLTPNNSQIKKLYKTYCDKKSDIKKIKKTYSMTAKTDSLVINKNMATKTMYNVFKKQKKYNQALLILELMKKQKKYKMFVKKEYVDVIKKKDDIK